MSHYSLELIDCGMDGIKESFVNQNETIRSLLKSRSSLLIEYVQINYNFIVE